MADLPLAEWAALAEDATPGPWGWYFYDGFMALVTEPHTADEKDVLRPWDDEDGSPSYCRVSREDAAFIAAAREMVPALIAEVERLAENRISVATVYGYELGLRDAANWLRAHADEHATGSRDFGRGYMHAAAVLEDAGRIDG